MHEKISTSHESHNEDDLCVRLERVMKIHKEGTLSLSEMDQDWSESLTLIKMSFSSFVLLNRSSSRMSSF